MRRFRYGFFPLAVLLAAGCTLSTGPQYAEKNETAVVPVPQAHAAKREDASVAAACNREEPADLRELPQTAAPYLARVRERRNILPVQRRYRTEYYRVWADGYRPDPPEKVRWPFRTYTAEDAYGENLRPLPPSWFDGMRKEADWKAYNSVGEPAIALRRLDLRNFPTRKPLFHDPCKAGEGFPFDYLQNSAVFANEPLYLSHYSADKAWAYVLTSYATGWVPADAIAVVNARQRKALESRPLIALLEEERPLYTRRGDYLFRARVGMLLPLEREDGTAWTADAVIEGGVRRSRVIPVTLPKRAAAKVPMRFTAENIGSVLDGIIGKPYGWGGLYGDRDCSAMIRDIFAPFGIWLPRNSFQQSQVGKVVSLEGLDDAAKAAKIRNEAVPFETLLYLKGHIMLYLGVYGGEPVVLHTVWGIKTVRDDGSFGRHIVGKTVITTLEFGKELPGYRPENSLLRKLVSMNLLLTEE